MLTIPKGMNKKPIVIAPAPSGSVDTTTIGEDFPVSRIHRGMAFAAAHMDLGIVLRSDVARGRGWVTLAEAEMLHAKMGEILAAEGLI